jgi:hypothetical protein
LTLTCVKISKRQKRRIFTEFSNFEPQERKNGIKTEMCEVGDPAAWRREVGGQRPSGWQREVGGWRSSGQRPNINVAEMLFKQ